MPETKWFTSDPHVSPFLKALADLREEASRQGDLPEHVSTIIAMIDQYAESATGNRHYFCEPSHIFPEGKPIR